MGMPLKTDYKAGKGVTQIPASDMNTIGNVLNDISITIAPHGSTPEIKRTNASGSNWAIIVPESGAEDTTGKTKYMVYQITDDTTTPPTAGFNWVYAHA